MSRARDRFLSAARARLRRLVTTAHAAVTSDEDATLHRGADLAEAEVVTRTAGRLRGGLAKVAQLRAYFDLADGLSDGARAELATLWDRMPPDPPQAIRQVILEDLGAPVERLFASWDDQPLAAASLGQVHAATLADGTELAVKVQYPGVAAALDEDLSSPALLRQLVGPGLAEGAERAALATLRDAMHRELDYVAEREALLRFGRVFHGDAQVVLPRPLAELSSGRVLTMTRLRGRPLQQLVKDTNLSMEARARVARTLFHFAFGSPLRHGLVNGDPHPGNYLVVDETAGRIGFVDFGFVVELGELQAIDRRLFLSLVHRDGEALRFAAHEEGLVPRVGVFDHAAWRDFERALGAPFLVRGARRFGPAQAGELARATSHLIRSGAVRLPPAAVVLWRQRIGVLTVLGSLAATLDLRRALCEELDDDQHPTPLYERYR